MIVTVFGAIGRTGRHVDEKALTERGHQASDLERVVVRPPRLTDGPRRGSLKVGYFGLGPKYAISRADLAAFMLDQLESHAHLLAAPMVAQDS